MGKINVDYDVLNQKGSPAWYSDLFANIPTPGYTGRMFISTDTFAFYRDNGSGWDLTGGPGIGTITGSGVIGQVSFFSGTQVLSGNSNLFWDNTNNRLGINTNTPTTSLDIHTTGNAAIFNGTGTNNAFLTFANAGVNKWYIGNNYNAAANDYQIFDVTNSTARLTIKNTGASTLIGTFTATSLIKSGGTSSQILLADGSTTPTSTFGAGSVTNVSALTLGTSGTDLTSTVANSTTTPVITLNVPTASATNRGALSSADWTTFNNKQATITLTTIGTSGAATLVGATLNVPNYTNVGTVTSVAALTLGTSGTDLSSTVANSTSTPVITLNVPTASATNRGALSTTDWTTFNNKQATISVTSPVVLTGATISMPAATTSVNGYLTSTDWNTFNNKTSNLGTVTDVVALTIGTTGIDITSTAVTTTTTPVITLNIPTASASNRGALSSTDWTIFNNKQATLSLTTTGTSGAATLVANTLNIPNYGSALSGYLPLSGGTLTGALGGTSAELSLGLKVTGSNITTGTGAEVVFSSGKGLFLTFNRSTSTYLPTEIDGSTITLSTSSTPKLSIASTGASTFSSGIGTLGYNASTTYAALFNGSVGIGTTTPLSLLHIASADSNEGLRLTRANGTFGFRFTRTGLIQGTLTDGTTFQTAIELSEGNSSANNYLNLQPTAGNVGIGTSTPNIKLTINAGSSDALSIRNADTNYENIVMRITGGVGFISMTKNGGSYLPLAFYTSDTERYKITAAGVNNYTSRGNYLGATDNGLFSLNSGGTLYTVGFSPTATASSTNTFTLTTGTTTWIYTGTGVATWTLPNPSGNNQIYWIKNAGTGIITLNAFSGTNIINNAAASVGSITIAVGATAVIAQDGNVKSYQLQ